QRLPLHQWPYLDCAAHSRGRDTRGELERRVEIIHVDHDEAADVLLRVDERPVREQRLAVLNAHGRRSLDRLQLLAGDYPGRVAQREVVGVGSLTAVLRTTFGVTLLPLVFRKLLERLLRATGIVLEQVLHAVLLRSRVLPQTTNANGARGH